MRPTVIYREDSALETRCEYCHLTPVEALAVLHHRLKNRQETRACRACVCRLGDEAIAQIHAKRPS